MRTPLTYYGGKQALARQIVPLFPPHRSYLEPFAGGAAVLFAKAPAERETLNDLDGQVMRFWRALRERPDELAAAVAATPYGRQEWRVAEAVRKGRAPMPEDDVEAARLLLACIDQSFSRSSDGWSVPCIGDGRGRWQPGSWANLPPKLVAAAERLRNVALESGDACDLIPRWDEPDALLYVDPPYTGEHRRRGKHGSGGMNGYLVDDDGKLWGRLVEALLGLERAAVVLSGYPCEEVGALEGAGWRRVPLRMRRTVQERGGDALPMAPEVVWLNERVPDAPQTLFEEDAHEW